MGRLKRLAPAESLREPANPTTTLLPTRFIWMASGAGLDWTRNSTITRDRRWWGRSLPSPTRETCLLSAASDLNDPIPTARKKRAPYKQPALLLSPDLRAIAPQRPSTAQSHRSRAHHQADADGRHDAGLNGLLAGSGPYEARWNTKRRVEQRPTVEAEGPGCLVRNGHGDIMWQSLSHPNRCANRQAA
jgi:hypothetical protein